MEIDIELSGLTAVIKQLDPKAQDVISVRTVNKVAPQAKTAAEKAIREDYNIKKKDIRLKLHRARRGLPIAVIAGMRKHIPFARFKNRQMKPGTRVEMRKGKPVMYKHAFKATMSSGHAGVYVRQMESGKRSGRTPIQELKGPSPGQLLKRSETIKDINQLIKAKFKKIFSHEIDYYFSKQSGGRK